MRSSYSPFKGRQVVVQVGDDSVGGTIVKANRARVVLADSALIGARPAPMDGQVVIPASMIRWVQVLP